MAIRTYRWRTAVAAGLLSVCASALQAHAQVLPGPALGPDTCSPPTGEGLGAPGSITNAICNGAGIVFVGPAVGQVATVIGPVVIGPNNIGSSVVSAGPGIAVP